MSAVRRWLELVGGPFRASWRAALGWTVVFVLLVVSTVAFWPAFKGSTALDAAMKVLPQGMLEAFGLQDFASAAGYLRGGLYEVIVPLMFAAAGVMFANSATAAEEDAGRLEVYVAQPITRRSLLVGPTGARSFSRPGIRHRRLPGGRSVPAQRCARALAECLALGMGTWGRSSRQSSGAMAICGSGGARIPPGDRRDRRLRSPRYPVRIAAAGTQLDGAA